MLRSVRLRRRLSQGSLARRAEMHPSYLSRIENGKIQPSLETALRLADALKISLVELLGHAPGGERGGACPISPTGQCLVGLMEAGSDPGRPGKSPSYSSRQIQTLHDFARLVEGADPDLLSAFQIFIRQYSKGPAKGANGSVRGETSRSKQEKSRRASLLPSATPNPGPDN